MSVEAAIRIACGTVVVVVGAYGTYKFCKFFNSVSRKMQIVRKIQSDVEQLHVGDAALEGEQLRQFMVELDSVRDVLQRVELDFSSVTEEDLLTTLSVCTKMFVKYSIAKE